MTVHGKIREPVHFLPLYEKTLQIGLGHSWSKRIIIDTRLQPRGDGEKQNEETVEMEGERGGETITQTTRLLVDTEYVSW